MEVGTKGVKVSQSSKWGNPQDEAELVGEMRRERNRVKTHHQPAQLCWATARIVTSFRLQIRITARREK